MKKLVSFTTLFVIFISITAFGQGWTYVGPFPDASFTGNSGGHGIAVDPDGKVWVQQFGVSDTIIGGGDTALVRQVFVFNEDGSPASFNGFWTVTVDGVTDTLFNSHRGLRADGDGNILITSFDVIYRVNYQTGEGMDKIQPLPGVTLVASGVATETGNVFNGPVIPGSPIVEMTPDLSAVLGNVVDASVGFSRTMEVSADGNTVYWAGYTNGFIHVYQRPDEFSAYDSVGILMDGVHCEGMGWDPSGRLWISGGSFNDMPNPGSGWTPGSYYAYDFTTESVVDSLQWQFNTPGNVNERNRGIAFSPDGMYAYLTCFGASDYPIVQKFENTGVAVRPVSGIVEDYALSQNYPNPFNPTTEIKFSVVKEGLVSLKVYDLLGKEVSTLVDEHKSAGNYTVDFNASDLASGTYIYTLSVNGVSISKKMMLLK